jgi:hypothetical protein
VLTRLFMDRGVRLDRTYQLNFGGNTDFLNMLERERLESKKISKTNAVTSMLDYELDPDDIHVGPSDHVPWLLDRKWCYIRMEGTTYGDVPLNAELKLEVWDSPNSAGVITDAIRCLKLGLDRGPQGHARRARELLHEEPAPSRSTTTSRSTGSRRSSGARTTRRWSAPRPWPRRRTSGWPARRRSRPPLSAMTGNPGRPGGRAGDRLEAPHKRGRGRFALVERLASCSIARPRGCSPTCPPRPAWTVIGWFTQASYLLWPTKRRWSQRELRPRPRQAAGQSGGPAARPAGICAPMPAISSS